MDYRELPEEFLEKMKQFLGEEYPEYLASYEEEPRSGLRVNTGRLTPEQFLEMAQTADWNLKPVPWTKNGFYYQANAHPGIRGTTRDSTICRNRVRCHRRHGCRSSRATGFWICARHRAVKVRNWRRN
nr:hypothetical protein [Clostridium sp. AF50-3]